MSIQLKEYGLGVLADDIENRSDAKLIFNSEKKLNCFLIYKIVNSKFQAYI